MTAEQLYDSLLLATGADKTPLATGDHDRRRHEWLQQFVHAFQTDENDESINFESNVRGRGSAIRTSWSVSVDAPDTTPPWRRFDHAARPTASQSTP